MGRRFRGLGESDPGEQAKRYREAMGRDAGEPVPLGLTLTTGRLAVTLDVRGGAMPASFDVKRVLNPPRPRPPMARFLAQRFVVGAALRPRVAAQPAAEVVSIAPPRERAKAA